MSVQRNFNCGELFRPKFLFEYYTFLYNIDHRLCQWELTNYLFNTFFLSVVNGSGFFSNMACIVSGDHKIEKDWLVKMTGIGSFYFVFSILRQSDFGIKTIILISLNASDKCADMYNTDIELHSGTMTRMYYSTLKINSITVSCNYLLICV